MKRFFITGTDTDCGKTYVTCQLLQHLKQKNKNALAIKPVTSGCFEHDHQLVSEDIVRLEQYNGTHLANISPWRLRSPVSPHIAAAQDEVSISAAAIADFCLDGQFEELEYLLIEGAGGLLVPLNNDETWVDFLKISETPVILVVGLRLGCINHALLTEFALKAHNITCVGWVANCIDSDMLSLSENIVTLTKKMKLPLLAIISHGGQLQDIALKKYVFS